MGTCYYVEHFGVICPGCGIQRAFIALLKGNLLESIMIYPALIPFMAMMLFLPAHLIFRFKHGAMILKYTFIFTAAIVVINYIIKLTL